MRARLCATLAAALLSLPAWAAGYAVFSVPQATAGTFPMARNGAGDVAGYCVDASNAPHGFVRRATGETVSFDIPSDSAEVETQPVTITDDGTVSGCYREVDGPNTVVGGFRRAADGSFSFFAVAGASATFVTAGNRAGQLTGYFYASPDNTVQGFVTDPAGGYAVFGAGKGQILAPTAINDLGDVTGSVNFRRGFLRAADGTLETFSVPAVPGLPGLPEVVLSGIDNQGTVVGSADNAICGSRGCVKPNLRAIVRQRDGSLGTFQVSGRLTEAPSINNAGLVNGTFYTGGCNNGPASGFVRDAAGAFTTDRVQAMTRTYGGLIGDDGIVLGTCRDATGLVSGYLRTP